MAKIFISYSRRDEAFARKLVEWLIKRNVEVWIDIEGIHAGVKWSAAIQEGLDACDIMIVLVSPSGTSSLNVEDEWQYYIDKNKPVIPLILNPTEIPYQLRRYQYIDFSDRNNFKEALNQLKGNIKRSTREVRKLKTSEITGIDNPKITVTDSDDLWAERKIKTWQIGLLVSIIFIIIVVIAINIIPKSDQSTELVVSDIPPPPPLGTPGVVQFVNDTRNSLAERPVGNEHFVLSEYDYMVENIRITSTDGTLLTLFQGDAFTVLEPSSLITYLFFKDTEQALDITLTLGEVFVDSGDFPGVRIYTPNNNATFTVQGSKVSTNAEPDENIITYACFEGDCLIHDTLDNRVILPTGTQLQIIGDANNLLMVSELPIINIPSTKYEHWNRLCANCLEHLIPSTEIAMNAVILTPTATITATLTPTATQTSLPTETSTLNPTPTATNTSTPISIDTLEPSTSTPTMTPDTITLISTLSPPLNYDGLWLIKFDDTSFEQLISSDGTCAAIAPVLIPELGNMFQFPADYIEANISSTSGQLQFVSAIPATIMPQTLSLISTNQYQGAVNLLPDLPALLNMSVTANLTMTFGSTDRVDFNYVVSENAIGCVNGTVTGHGYHVQSGQMTTWQITELPETLSDPCSLNPIISQYSAELQRTSAQVAIGRMTTPNGMQYVLFQAIPDTSAYLATITTLTGTLTYHLDFRPDNTVLLTSRLINQSCTRSVSAEGLPMN